MSTHRTAGRERAHLPWIKSSYSGSGGGNCVEVARPTTGYRAVRDSKNPTGPTLIFSHAQWATFTTGIHSGEFD